MDRPGTTANSTAPRRHRWLHPAALLCALAMLPPGARAALTAEAADAATATHIARLIVTESAELRAFYRARDYRPAWCREALLEALATAVEELADDGLTPRHYGAAALVAQRDAACGARADAAATAAFELHASRVWLTALRDLGRGRAPPDWVRATPGPEFDPTPVSGDLDAGRLDRSLARARPDDAGYPALRAGLAEYRQHQHRGGWEPLPAGATLRPATSDPRVPALRARLAAAGQAAPATADPDYFDDQLAAAVREFQLRHQLAGDAIVGPQTLAALNVPVAQRIAQLRVALERARWLRAVLPDTHVLVDIAGHELSLERAGGTPWRTRVIVGRPSRQTPVLRSAITHLEFHPTWTIPPTILRKDVLPKVLRDPHYLAREGIEVLDPSGARLRAADVDWSRPGTYLLRQGAGGTNPLGRVVIRFPNHHLVYLHDTPAADLFAHQRRAISSGCVRVEHALDLVQRLLVNQPGWGADEVLAAAAGDQYQRVRLARPMPLLLWYRTVRADAQGRLIFAPDIYGLDGGVLAALDGAGTW